MSRLALPLHVLAGPTAVGKTAFALAWARSRGATIVNADAFCAYRGMDLGTAKPSVAERTLVPHELVDVRDPHEPWTVADYVAAARSVLARLERDGRPVLVVGGAGLYLQAWFGPVADGVVVPEDVRSRVAALAAAEGLPGLVAALRRGHPDSAGLAGLDLANPRRVAAALGRHWATGRTHAELLAAHRASPGPFADRPVRALVLERTPADLAERLHRRARAMVADGLVEEVARLRERGLERNPSAARAIGYRETLDFLDRAPGAPTDLDALAAAIARNSVALARRQRTWLRHQLPDWVRRRPLAPDETGPTPDEPFGAPA